MSGAGENTYILRTLGCKANISDGQLIEAELQKHGWRPIRKGDSARLCIVNSCTVTDEADRQSRKLAARLARENPEGRVVVTGCAAEIDPERIAASKGIHYVIGNQDKPGFVDLILKKLESESSAARSARGEVLGEATHYAEMISRHPMDRDWPSVEESFTELPAELNEQGKTRAFLKIQEGCNSFCTYCIIPYGRGPSRSLRPREVLTQIRNLVSHGVKEVVITGTNVGDYGVDWGSGPALEELFRLIFAETDLPRLRVSSLDPTEITPGLMEIMAREPRFCPHFHVSLQSANSKILRLMKRKYGLKEVETCLGAIAKLRTEDGGAFVGMDVITGFPGETEEDFNETLSALESLPWTRLHVFPYSERSGTPATRLPQSVKKEERASRARKLGALSLERLHQHYLSALSKSQNAQSRVPSVLLEKPGIGPDGKSGWIAGYSPNYLKVIMRAEGLTRNQLVSIQPTGIWIDRAAGDVSLVSV